MRKIKPKTDKYMSPSAIGLKKGKSKPIYPTFRIDLDHIPEAKDWKIGKEYSIEMKVKMVGLSQSRFDNSAEFEIKEIEAGDAEQSEDEGDETDAEDNQDGNE